MEYRRGSRVERDEWRPTCDYGRAKGDPAERVVRVSVIKEDKKM